MLYRVFETSPFLEDLGRLPRPAQGRIRQKLDQHVYPQLRRQPYFGPNIRKLRAWQPEAWRYRLGPWRLFYEVDEGKRVVSMLTIDWRKDAYH